MQHVPNARPSVQRRPSRLRRLATENPPARFVRHVIRKPEYGVLYVGTAFWIIAGSFGIGRPLLDVIAAHV
jgi:hypothetical protein